MKRHVLIERLVTRIKGKSPDLNLRRHSYLSKTESPRHVFNSRWPTCQVLDRIADKWTVLVGQAPVAARQTPLPLLPFS